MPDYRIVSLNSVKNSTKTVIFWSSWAYLTKCWENHPVYCANFQESLTLFREGGDLDGIQASLHGLGYICWILGEYEQGRELHQEMLRLCQETGSQGGIARALGDLGIDAYALQQFEKAHELFEQSLAIYREIGNAIGMYDELGDLAHTTYSQLSGHITDDEDWVFAVEKSHVKVLQDELKKTITVDGTSVERIEADAIEDFGILVQYQIA